MSLLRSKRTGEILLTSEQYKRLQEAYPDDILDSDDEPKTIRLGPIPLDKDYGPYWVSGVMDSYANSEWCVEEWIESETEVVDGEIYYVPRIGFCNYIWALDWFDDPALWVEIENIVNSTPPVVEQESTGLGAAIGALAFAAGIAVLRNKKKTSVSKKQTQAVEEKQEVAG